MAAATAALGFSIATLAWSGDSHAQPPPPPADPGAADAARQQPPSSGTPAATPPPTLSTPALVPQAPGEGYSGPSRGVIATGVFALAISYTVSVVVAASSHLHADSQNLYYPVVGPWLDIANRPACGPGSTACGTEVWNIVALSINGFAQAWGVGAIIAGMFVWEHPSPAVSSLQIAPTRIGLGGYGLGATGTF
jgi:hypothetical protein